MTLLQGGLAAILGPNSNTTPSQAHDLTLRARLYYYARINSLPPIDFDAYKLHLATKSVPAVGEKPQNPTRFDEIVALITSGKPIPGIRDIPPTVLPDQSTKPTASRRRKPWEKDGNLAVNERTFGDQRDDIVQQDAPSGGFLRRM